MKWLGNGLILVAGVPLLLGGWLAVPIIFLGATTIVLGRRLGRLLLY